MTPDDFEWSHYWSVDFPGLSHQQAVRLVELARAEDIADWGIVLDPAHTYVVGMDVATVSALVAALELAAAAGGLSALDRTITTSVSEQLADWLDARLEEVRSRGEA